MATRLVEAYPVASNACARCKDSKKRCNRVLPSCGRCSRMARGCIYPVDNGNEMTLVTTGKLMSSSIPPLRARNNPSHMFGSNWHSFALPVEPSSWNSEHWITRLPLQCSLDVHVNQQIASCVIDFITRDETDLNASCRTYFEIITPRLPIISEATFFESLGRLYATPDAHFSLVLLCMSLIARGVLRPDEPNLPGTMYYTAKSFFASLCAGSKGSIELVQSGILIAMYEFCQGLLEASRFTLSTCALMGYNLGLDKMLKLHFQLNPSTKGVVEAGRCLWWAIFVIERMTAIHYLKQKPSFICKTPALDDLLPLNINSHRHKVGIISDSEMKIRSVGINSTQIPVYFLFSQVAQAAYLLHMVFETILDDSSDLETRLSDAASLDNHLQAFLLSVIGLPRIDNTEVCGSYTIIMSSMFLLLLHKMNLEKSEGRQQDDSNTQMTLRSLLKMSIQTVEFGDRSVVDYILEFPYWTMYLLYITATILINYENTGLSDEERRHGVVLIKNMLAESSTRWRIGGMYLEELDKFEKARITPGLEGLFQWPDLISTSSSSSSSSS